VTGLSFAGATWYDDMAVTVRFSLAGVIDAIKGADFYQKNTTVRYIANTPYHFRAVVNVPARVYSVYVTPKNGSEVLLASNYEFRVQSSAISSSLSYLNVYDSRHTVCNFSVVPQVNQISISVFPSTITIQPGASQLFTSQVLGVVDPGVTWSTTGGAVSASGLYIAPNTPGVYQVRATSVADPSKIATATVTVPGSAPIPGVQMQLSPMARSVVANATVQFVANVPGGTNTAVTWSASGGTINGAGLYIAPAAPGTYIVTATSNADATISASTNITVVGAYLSWSAVSGDVASYRIYRALQAQGPFLPIATVPSSQLNYLDTNLVANSSHWYVATTVDSTGAESGYSNLAVGIAP
jgi:hypothetical protein